jgi:hypothetical protein
MHTVRDRYAGLPERTRTVVRRVAITFLVLACIGALVVAANHTKTGDQTIAESGSGIVEQLIPTPNSNVLQQAQVGIDLVSGWTGVLLINGREIPEDQLTRRPELYQVLYLPEDGKDIEQLPQGKVCVEALVWPVDQTRADARPISWCFNVT